MNRKIAPPIKNALDFKLELKPYEFYKLDNGIPVYSVEAGEEEVLQLELVFYAGNMNEKLKGTAATTNFLIRNGTTTRTAFQINEEFDYYGAYCNRSCYNETAIISLHSLSKHVHKLLPVMEDMLTNSIFPETELDIYKQNSKQSLKVKLQKCEFVAGRLINQYLYGENHPYGSSTGLEDIDKLNIDDIRKFYKKHYLEGKCIIFIAGKLPKNMSELLNKSFGGLNLKKPSKKIIEVPPSPAKKKKYRIENDPAGVQGAIRMASHFPNRHHPDFKKAIVLNTFLGGYFGSRLMRNIREEKGYTYGIYSYLQNHLMQSAWVISTEAGRKVSEATVEEVYKEMKNLQDVLIDKDELLLVKNFMLGSLLSDLDGPFHIIGKWKNIILNNLDDNYFYDSINAIKTATAEEMQMLAKKYLKPGKFYELIVY